MAYLDGTSDRREHQRCDPEPDLGRAILVPAAVAAIVILAISLLFDSETEDSPWTSGGPAVLTSALALVLGVIAAVALALRRAATPGAAAMAGFTVLLATPIAVVGGYVLLSAIGA